MGRLQGRRALITGAGAGIGAASAERMAREGASVICTDVDQQQAEGTAARIEAAGGSATAMHLDVRDEAAVRDAVERAGAQSGGLQILFNNAGVANQDWQTTIAINLSGVFYGLKHAAPLMARNGGGSIINTASILGLVGLGLPAGMTEDREDAPDGPSYVAAKHGVIGLTRQYAVTWGGQGVRVNAIAPGFIETSMTAEFRETEEGRAFLVARHPAGRLGRAEEIAAAAAFLASDEASFVNGVVLPVDGGYTAQ